MNIYVHVVLPHRQSQHTDQNRFHTTQIIKIKFKLNIFFLGVVPFVRSSKSDFNFDFNFFVETFRNSDLFICFVSFEFLYYYILFLSRSPENFTLYLIVSLFFVCSFDVYLSLVLSLMFCVKIQIKNKNIVIGHFQWNDAQTTQKIRKKRLISKSDLNFCDANIFQWKMWFVLFDALPKLAKWRTQQKLSCFFFLSLASQNIFHFDFILRFIWVE